MEHLLVEIYEILSGFGEAEDDFGIWDLRDKSGNSAAHIAARYNNLPADFDQWELIDADGASVRDIYEKYNS